MARMRKLHGAKNFSFTPLTYCLPADWDKLYADFLGGGGPFIVKPNRWVCTCLSVGAFVMGWGGGYLIW